MTQTAAPLLGLGAVIFIGSQDGTPTFQAIGGNTKIAPPKPKWGTDDVTTLNQSTPSHVYIKTLKEEGDATGSGFWESADPGQQALEAAFQQPSSAAGGGLFPFKIELPVNGAGGQTTTGDAVTFSAFVTDFAIGEAEPGKPIPYSFTLKVNGTPAPTFTEGA